MEIAGMLIDYLVALNEKNEEAIRKVAEKSSKKLVKAYCDAIRSQHKNTLKTVAKKEKDQECIAIPVIRARQTNFLQAIPPARSIA